MPIGVLGWVLFLQVYCRRMMMLQSPQLIWWIHFLLSLVAYFFRVNLYPEGFGIVGNHNHFAAEHDVCTRDNIKASVASYADADFSGQVLIPSDGRSYGRARDQYASVTYAQALSPSVIVLAQSEADVQAAVKFASNCGYTVSIRSGGHAYLGTSSCDSSQGPCLQIDVRGLNHRILSSDNQVRLGPGNKLEEAADFLVSHGRFLPTGECPSVALGGHVQTGGFGLFGRAFGPLASRVAAFSIVLDDGQVYEITRPANNAAASVHDETIPTSNATHSNNDDIFYAVLGGASGSWGVVTDMTLDTLKDEDYFAVFWRLAYWWDAPEDTEHFVHLMREWVEIARAHEADHRWSILWSVIGAKNVPLIWNRFHVEGVWVAPVDQKDDYDYSFFEQLEDLCAHCKRYVHLNVTEPLSQIWRRRYLRTLISKRTGREFPLPYTRAMQGALQLPSPDGMEGIVRDMFELLPGRLSPHFTIHEILMAPGMEDPKIALPWPRDRFGVTLDYFYIPIPFLHEEQTQYHENRTLDFGRRVRQHTNMSEDHRMYWAAYDSPDMEKDWPLYFESKEKYQRLQAIKANIDPTNLFRNSMSIPLPTITMNATEVNQVNGNETRIDDSAPSIPLKSCPPGRQDGNDVPAEGACIVAEDEMLRT